LGYRILRIGLYDVSQVYHFVTDKLSHRT